MEANTLRAKVHTLHAKAYTLHAKAYTLHAKVYTPHAKWHTLWDEGNTIVVGMYFEGRGLMCINV